MWACALGQVCIMSTSSLLHAVYGFTCCASVKAPHTSAYTLRADSHILCVVLHPLHDPAPLSFQTPQIPDHSLSFLHDL